MRENGLINSVVTDTAITLYWEKTENTSEGYEYHIMLNDTLVGKTQKTHFTIENLAEDTDYACSVNIFQRESCCQQLDICHIKTEKAKKRLDITKAPYFAVGDGKTLNTAAIQKALDDCTHDAVVYFPAGIYLTGALCLHSDMELYLEKEAVLQGTAQPEDYLPYIHSRFEGIEMDCYSSLLNMGVLDHKQGPNCENILIHGQGKIASGGRELAEAVISLETEKLKDFLVKLGDKIKEYEKPETIPGRMRPRLINISNCKNVRISGLTLADGASWNVHMIYSENILTDHCVFHSENIWNGDGWDLDSSKNCTIFACTFYTGDDSIAIKSGKNPEGNEINRPSEHIRIFDCTCAFGHGITIGSEMSGGINDVKIWDCDLQNGQFGLEIKGTKKRGGYVKNVHVRDCILPRILFHSVSYNDDGIGASEPPIFENCSFTDIILLGQYMDDEKKLQCCTSIDLCGFDIPGYEIKDILFRRIRLKENKENEQSIAMKYCRDIRFDEFSYGLGI